LHLSFLLPEWTHRLTLRNPKGGGFDRPSGKGAIVNEPTKRQTVTFEELSYSNMITLNALVELLTEKGLLTQAEILERTRKLQSQTKVSM
jgi:hypothetical protein